MDNVPFLNIVKFVEKHILLFKPKIILTHFESDLNIDHQLAFKAVITASRPMSKCFVKKIYCFETPSSTDFNFTRNNFKRFNPNYYIDVSKFIKKKINILNIYKKELKKWPHSRSLKSIANLAKYRVRNRSKYRGIRLNKRISLKVNIGFRVDSSNQIGRPFK